MTRGELDAWKTEKCDSDADPVPEPWEGRRGRDESESEASRFVSFRMLEDVMDFGNGCRLYEVSAVGRLGKVDIEGGRGIYGGNFFAGRDGEEVR